jgi:hypothetical protein
MLTSQGIDMMVQAAAGAALVVAIGGFAIWRTKPWMQACVAAIVTAIITSFLIMQS